MLGCPHCKMSALQVWTCHPFHVETMSLPCCCPHMQWRERYFRCWLEPDGNFGWKSSRGGRWCQPAASSGGCETLARCRAARNSSAEPSLWLVVSSFAEKPAGQRSSPSSRNSPSTVLQEVSLAEMVSCWRQPGVLRPSPQHCGHLIWIKAGGLG